MRIDIEHNRDGERSKIFQPQERASWHQEEGEAGMKGLVRIWGDSRQRAYVYRDGWVRRWRTGRMMRGQWGEKGGIGWSRRVNLSRPLATLSRRAILRITSAASGQEMKIAPTLFNLDKSICYTTNGVAGWYSLEEATLCLSLEGIYAGTHARVWQHSIFVYFCVPWMHLAQFFEIIY